MKGWILALILLILLTLGFFLFRRGDNVELNNDGNKTESVEKIGKENNNTGTSTDTSTESGNVTVTLTSNGFSPKTVAIKRGEQVRWLNESSGSMWVASAQHPIHSAYSSTTLSEHCPDTTGTVFDQCANGNTYTFTFGKVGSWNYHNHSVNGQFGTIVVTE